MAERPQSGDSRDFNFIADHDLVGVKLLAGLDPPDSSLLECPAKARHDPIAFQGFD